MHKIEHKKKFGIIYLIKNKVNNKVYVGQTKQKNGFKDRYPAKGEGIERVYNYFNYSKKLGESYNKHLLNSIREYGFENFQVTEEFDAAYSKDELNEKEKYWIEYYNSTNPKCGYNYTVGGESSNGTSTENLTKEEYISYIGSRYKPVICLNTSEVFLTISDASKKTGVNPSGIRLNCIGEIDQTGNHGKIKKLKFKFMTSDGYIEGTKSRPMYCSTDKKFFKNPSEAGKYYNISGNSIFHQIKSKNPSGIKSGREEDNRRLIFFVALDHLMNMKLRPNNTYIDNL